MRRTVLYSALLAQFLFVASGTVTGAPPAHAYQDLNAAARSDSDGPRYSLPPLTPRPDNGDDLNAYVPPSRARRTSTADALDELRGTWMCVEAIQDGKYVDNFVGIRAIINGNDMTWIFPRADGNDLRRPCRIILDTTRNPKHLDWHPADQSGAQRMRRLYKIENGMFYMATNMSSTNRPSSFDNAKWVFRCRRMKEPKTDRASQQSGQNTSLVSSVSWGKVVDPNGECAIAQRDGRLTIQVPKGQYDLHYGDENPAKRFNAPRVLREVEGDFVAKVKVTANWDLGQKMPIGRNFSTAGLLVWDSERQYLRHERCYYEIRGSKKLCCYTAPVYDLNGTRVENGKATSPATFFKGPSTWLLMQRKGQTIYTWISHDGKNWIHNGTVATRFPNKVRIGVHAINGSQRELVAQFDELIVNER